jgi:hypothetical protein
MEISRCPPRDRLSTMKATKFQPPHIRIVMIAFPI